VVEIAEDKNHDKRLKKLMEVKGVTVEANQEVHPSYSWGIDRVNQHNLPLDNTVAVQGGAGVDVYVVDTGVDQNHPQFEGRVFFDKNCVDGTPDTDQQGHGTHVMGTILSKDYGLAVNARGYAVKVFGTGSGTVADILEALTHVMTVVPTRGRRAVVNLSLGINFPHVSVALEQAVAAVVDSGIAVSCAAGNDNADTCLASPAREPKCFAVGATDITDTKAWFSNHGTCTDINAPGVNIVSALPGNQLGTYSGTSMAAPHAAAAFARFFALNPTKTVAEARTALISSATSGVLNGLVAGTPNLLLFVSTPGSNCYFIENYYPFKCAGTNDANICNRGWGIFNSESDCCNQASSDLAIRACKGEQLSCFTVSSYNPYNCQSNVDTATCSRGWGTFATRNECCNGAGSEIAVKGCKGENAPCWTVSQYWPYRCEFKADPTVCYRGWGTWTTKADCCVNAGNNAQQTECKNA